MRLTLLLFASFALSWQVQPGVKYVVERQVLTVHYHDSIMYKVGDALVAPAYLDRYVDSVRAQYNFDPSIWIYARETYVAEVEDIGYTWQPVDTFTGQLDTIPAIEGVNYYTGRAVKGVVRSTVISTLYHDFAPGDISTVDIKSANVIQGDTLCYVKTRMQSKFWECAYTFKGGRATAVQCECELDFNRDGKVDLSDLIRFGTLYFAHVYTLSDFASFGEVYSRGSVISWR